MFHPIFLIPYNKLKELTGHEVLLTYQGPICCVFQLSSKSILHFHPT